MAWLEIVKQSITSKEVLDRYLGLNAYGRDGKYLCPFHKDKNPSISIHSRTGKWKCFGCGVGGDGIDFVMKYFNLDQYSALKMLNDDFNLGFEHYVKDSDEKIKKIKLEKARKDKLIEREKKITNLCSNKICTALRIMEDIYFKNAPKKNESILEFSQDENRTLKSIWASYQIEYLQWLDKVITKTQYSCSKDYPSIYFDIVFLNKFPEQFENIIEKELLDKNLKLRANVILDKLRENSIGLIADKFY